MSTLQIGSFELTVVSDGQLRMDPGTMFGPDQPAEWPSLVDLDHGRLPFSVNCLLVRAGERRILIDTGSGQDEPLLMERYGGGSGRLVHNLGALGLQPSDIDTVILSHAHGDHVGGATVPGDGGNGHVPTFPRARYWLWRTEWDYWTTPESIVERPFLERKLPPLKDVVELVDQDEVEVVPGVRLIAAPGHTPGHLCVAFTAGQEMAIYTGDLLHHASQLEHPDWSPAFDLLPEVSAASRQRILDRARRAGAILLTAHLPTPGIARPTTGGYSAC
jgi:glyoxylase-like metal-dependent hydrolase (beta-lactamase superfamily II)